MSLTHRQEILRVARSYLGTPYHHQGRIKGAGMDCVGLIICVCKDLGVFPPDFEFNGYTRRTKGNEMLRIAQGYLLSAKSEDIGQLILFHNAGVSHCAISSEENRIIHCVYHSSKLLRGVREEAFPCDWNHTLCGRFELQCGVAIQGGGMNG